MTTTRARPSLPGPLASLPDNPQAECLSPGFVERCLADAGFAVDGTEPMLSEITALTRARKP